MLRKRLSSKEIVVVATTRSYSNGFTRTVLDRAMVRNRFCIYKTVVIATLFI
jgi:hypothetical protein